MTKPLSKRETELHVFRKFCQILNSFEPEEFDSPDDPDFLKKDCSLAIELVEYHRAQHDIARAGSSKRMTEEAWLTLLGESKKEFEKQSQVRMDVRLFPCLHPNVKVHFSERLAKQVVPDLVRLVHHYENQSIKLDYLSLQHHLPPNLADYFSQIWIDPTLLYKQHSSWNPAKAAILEVLPAAVSEAILKKNKKLESYRSKAQEVWLLIHASPRPHISRPELGRESTVGKITEELRQLDIKTDFDRIYYLDEDEPELICLK